MQFSRFELRNDLAPGRSSTLDVAVGPRSELTVPGVFCGLSRLSRSEDMQRVDAGSVEVLPGATIRVDRP